MKEPHSAAARPTRTVFFLSDYGTRDEFVGVVHAVLTAASPGVTIIDLTHHIAPFDVRAGAFTLQRAAPYLGPGVVLAVVDPGVGSDRRGICLEVAPGGASPRPGPRFFVGPDNGLLIAAAEFVGSGSIARAVELAPGSGPSSVTFDGRDLFAPAAAALSRGVPIESLGRAIEPASVVRLPSPAVEPAQLANGRRTLRADVVWVDHFGNMQLAITATHAEEAQVPRTGTVEVAGPVDGGPARTLRCVETFADLALGELGLLVDANGHLAVVAGRASAAAILALATGEAVTLTW